MCVEGKTGAGGSIAVSRKQAIAYHLDNFGFVVHAAHLQHGWYHTRSSGSVRTTSSASNAGIPRASKGK